MRKGEWKEMRKEGRKEMRRGVSKGKMGIQEYWWGPRGKTESMYGLKYM